MPKSGAEMWRFFCVLFVSCLVVAAPTEDDQLSSRSSRVMLDTIISAGYVGETHHVTTEDGYILGVFRIPYARHQTSGNQSRPVVFCMHGLYGQSQNYIAAQPDLALGFNLADAGFDVWFGNSRGNVHSRAHITLDPDDPVEKMQFFDFSWEEIGMYDLPAMMDYVLTTTGSDKLHYIGHSQGGTVFLVLGSMRPEYNEKMASVHLLAGVGYQEYFPNEDLKAITPYTDIIYSVALAEGLVEFTMDLIDDILDQIGDVSRADLCFGNIKYKYMCDLVGARHFIRETNTTNEPSFGGGSLKQIAHYGQNIRDRIFKRFDYGSIDNMEIYGEPTPPLYNLGLITSNVVMHYTISDDLLDERDVLSMADDMPKTIVRKVARDTFEHSDFVIADDAKELVTDYIVASINHVHNTGEPFLLENEEQIREEEDEVTTPPTPEELPDAAVSISLNTVFKIHLLLSSVYYLM